MICSVPRSMSAMGSELSNSSKGQDETGLKSTTAKTRAGERKQVRGGRLARGLPRIVSSQPIVPGIGRKTRYERKLWIVEPVTPAAYPPA